MLTQIYRFVGEVVVHLSKIIIVVGISIGVSLYAFEVQKDELFFEVMDSFNTLYEVKEDELNNRYGIIDEDEMMLWQVATITTDVAYVEKEEAKPSRLIIASAIVCTKKLLPEKSEDITEDMLDEVNQCIEKQLNSAFIISKVYINHIESLPDNSPTKAVLQTIIVGCNEVNKIQDQGVTDYDETLTCIRKTVSNLNIMLDKEITKEKMKRGI